MMLCSFFFWRWVYPRVGGETERAHLRQVFDAGLSPRGRGNLGRFLASTTLIGSIPAWAGKPCRKPSQSLTFKVYPRVGGETIGRGENERSTMGLSPRGRGNRWPRRALEDHRRSIPAWAGKPGAVRRRTTAPEVYPRVGGETFSRMITRTWDDGLSPRGRGNPLAQRLRDSRAGSIPAWAGKPKAVMGSTLSRPVYPRVGGETCHAPACAAWRMGLSPRGRGNRGAGDGTTTFNGSIPAWAGKPPTGPGSESQAAVYPRVGGETHVRIRQWPYDEGLSPRGRGNLIDGPLGGLDIRSIPAWAGKPSPTPGTGSPVAVYPRVGGETRQGQAGYVRQLGLSPRGRGNRDGEHVARGVGRSIPAWAGKPACGPIRWPSARVYPRVGGETGGGRARERRLEGLSPRGRGNPGADDDLEDALGSIPAWAGKPKL